MRFFQNNYFMLKNLPNSTIASSLRADFPGIRFNESLKRFTTIGIGGKARYLYEATASSGLRDCLQFCIANKIKSRVLGAGSNVVISDAGFDGMIIINRAENWEILSEKPEQLPQRRIAQRFAVVGENRQMQSMPFQNKLSDAVLVRVESGARIIPLIKKLHAAGICGLHWFAGIPATVGGAVFMNMHGAGEFFGDYVVAAALYDGKNCRTESADYFQFDYDWSILHDTRETLLSVDLCLFRRDVEVAQRLSIGWARQKSLQPQRSAGCVFQNLTLQQQADLQLPTPSVGFIIDKFLNMKGVRIGDAMVSEKHAAFIVNTGEATAADVFSLVRKIQLEAKKKLGITLKSEIEFIGQFKEETCQNLS